MPNVDSVELIEQAKRVNTALKARKHFLNNSLRYLIEVAMTDYAGDAGSFGRLVANGLAPILSDVPSTPWEPDKYFSPGELVYNPANGYTFIHSNPHVTKYTEKDAPGESGSAYWQLIPHVNDAQHYVFPEMHDVKVCVNPGELWVHPVSGYVYEYIGEPDKSCNTMPGLDDTKWRYISEMEG